MFEQNFLRGTICVDGVPLQKVRRARKSHPTRPPSSEPSSQIRERTIDKVHDDLHFFFSSKKLCHPLFLQQHFCFSPYYLLLNTTSATTQKGLNHKVVDAIGYNRTKNPNLFRLFGYGLKYIG